MLSITGLTLTLNADGGRRPLVKNLDFNISQGSIIGLIGASGCGKSLTCLAVMGLLPGGIVRSQGVVRFRQKEIQDLPKPRLNALRGAELAMILQNPMSCFDPVFTIRHHFMETMASHENNGGNALSRIRTALGEVGFEDPERILSLYPFQMSGGMLQRVMVALALLMKAKLLIADEPTTDLDVVSQKRVLDLLSKMRSEHGMSILLVTHDLSVVAHLADRVAVMQTGEIVENESARKIFDHPRHPYTRSLIRAHFNLYDHRLNQLLGRRNNRPQNIKKSFSNAAA